MPTKRNFLQPSLSQKNSHGCFLKYFLDVGFPYFYSSANRGGEIYYRYSHNLSKELLSDSEDKQTPI